MKIRINDLARELEVKAKVILDILPEVGVTEKKTHSSSIEEDEAVRVRKHFSARSGSSSRERTSATEVKPKIDLSKISKPGDVARLLREREQQQQHPPAPPAKAPAVTAPPATPPVAASPQGTPATPPSTKPVPGQPIVPQRRMITPQTGPRPVYTAPPPRAAAPSAPQGRPMQGAPGTRSMQSQGGPGQRPQGVVRGQ